MPERYFSGFCDDGQGIVDLKLRLDNEAGRSEAHKNSGHFRMSVDRAFVIDGAGIVVTGAISSGAVKIDDRLVLLPDMTEVRVRGIHAQNRKATEAVAGERCALNIVAQKLSVENLRRGQWLVAAPIAHATSRFDARVKLLASESRALRHWSQVHLHIGAADLMARIGVLGARQIEPGESAIVQVVTGSLYQRCSANTSFFATRLVSVRWAEAASLIRMLPARAVQSRNGSS